MSWPSITYKEQLANAVRDECKPSSHRVFGSQYKATTAALAAYVKADKGKILGPEWARQGES